MLVKVEVIVVMCIVLLVVVEMMMMMMVVVVIVVVKCVGGCVCWSPLSYATPPPLSLLPFSCFAKLALSPFRVSNLSCILFPSNAR